MIRLAELTLYPIKSCGGIVLQKATITKSGLASGLIHDREWMVVDARGQFITQRTHPKMATITPSINKSKMILSAPGMPPLAIPLERRTADSRDLLMEVRVWKDHLQAIDCGDAVADWLSTITGDGCRLVRFDPQAKRIASLKWTQGAEATNLFSDSFPFLVLSQASLDDLNERLRAEGREALPMNRFRPNIVISGVPPYAEDRTQSMQVGDAALQLVRPCQRCPIPAIDQTTGIAGPNPNDILKTYHTSELLNNAVTFGVHAILQHGEGATLRVGQIIKTHPLN